MILVTGATGTVGSETVKQLITAGSKVRAMARNPAKATAIHGPDVEVVRGDLAEPETLAVALRGIDRAFLLPPNDQRTIAMQDNFIAAARSAGTSHIVRLSILGADLESPVPLLRAHAHGQARLEASGMPFTELQPNSFMQNVFRSAPTIAAQGAIYQPCEDARISHVDARDVAAAAARALTEEGHYGKTYVLTGPDALSFDQVAQVLATVLQKPVRYVNISPEAAKRSHMEFGAPEWLADALNALHAFYRENKGAAVTDTVAAVTRKPPISFDQFARDYVAKFQAG